jgi:dihydropyrimidinase
MFDLVIRGGTVVTPAGAGHFDVGVRGERIIAVERPGTLPVDGVRVVDATGKLVIPGGIDPHVHAAPSAIPVAKPTGRPPKIGRPEHVSRAALFGGTTTLLDFASASPDKTLEEAVTEKVKTWSESYCDFGLHLMLKPNAAANLIDQIPDVVRAGFPSFKAFLTDIQPIRTGQLRLNMGEVWELMGAIAEHGGILAVHAEDDEVVMYMHDKLRRQGTIGYEHLHLVHSDVSEAMAVRRIVGLVRHIDGAALYVMHLSARGSLDAVAEARTAGAPVYGETLHNFAMFTSEDYCRLNGILFHTFPSLKSEDDRTALWGGLLGGDVSTVATDEGCTWLADKTAGRTIFDAIGGHVGVETRLAVVYTEGVVRRGMPLERFVALTSTNAARLFGLFPRKGTIAIDSDADIVVFDPSVKRKLRLGDLHDSDYSIWEGTEVRGWPIMTILRGRVVVDGRSLKAPQGYGRLVLRKIDSEIRAGPVV